MTFGRFHCIAGNFLMIRCRILNFKIFNFFSMVKKYSVCRFAPRPVRVLDKFPHSERFFSPFGKNLSPCGKFNGMQNINKNLGFSPCGNRLRINCLYSTWRIYCTARDLYRTGRKISRRAGTCPGQVADEERSGESYTF
jgi:hypothetical protein